HGLSVGYAFDGAVCGRVQERREVVIAMIPLWVDGHTKMRVGVEQARQHREDRKINYLCAGGNPDISANLLDALAFNQDDLVWRDVACLWIEHPARPDGDDLCLVLCLGV